MTTGALVAIYLTAIVAANVSVAMFGPSVVILNVFLFIGLDLTTRDALHDRWQGRGLWWRMLALILTGGLLSWLVDRDAGRIAIASSVAFLAAGTADAIIYTLLRARSRRVRVNGSNVVSAGVDSVIFPTIAFGELLPLILGQWLAKVFGGAVWLEVLSALSLWQGHRRVARHVDS